MYNNVKEKINEIVEVCEKVPERYRERCFEILLNALLEVKQTVEVVTPIGNTVKEELKVNFRMPFDIKAFLQQYEISEEKIHKLFLVQNEGVAGTYHLDTSKKAQGQIQLALLTALENALQNKKFVFSAEKIKQRCQEHGCYDVANFQPVFKRNSDLFKDLNDPENVELSPAGKQKLAETVLTLAK